MVSSWQKQNQELKDAKYELLAMTADRRGNLTTSWLDPASSSRVFSNLEVSDGRFPSLAAVLPEIAWDEREIHDLFGWIPTGHPDLRPLVRTPRWRQDFFPMMSGGQAPKWLDVEPDLPAKKVEGEGVTIMKVGPTHAGIIESGHFVFSLIGENILHLDAHLFQNHRGAEALLEEKPLQQVAPLVTRVCAADTVSNQANWALALEQLAGFKQSPQLVKERIILLEAERVLSHLNDLAQIPAGVGFQVAHQRALAMKELWQRSLKTLFGHRFLFDTIRPGWARYAPSDTLLADLSKLRSLWIPWKQLVSGHHGFVNRMQGVGKASLDQVIRLGAQGVTARAAGKMFDARQSLPWYSEFFRGPLIQSSGDVQGRFRVRLDELEASLEMIEQAALGLSRTNLQDQKFTPPLTLSGRAVTFTESPHGMNVHDVTLEDGRITRYHMRSASYRNWPLMAQAVAGNGVADFPLINKSFELCYSCTDR